jgi:superfamily II DNA or RNA helicase
LSRSKPAADSALEALEFHRSGFGLLPEGTDPDPGLAVQAVLPTGIDRPSRSCTCKASRKKTCRHLKRLVQLRAELESHFDGASPYESFQASLWRQLGEALFAGDRTTLEDVRSKKTGGESGGQFFRRLDEGLLLRRCGRSPSDIRLLERLGFINARNGADRAGLLKKLSLLLRTPTETALNERDVRSQLQVFEESFFGRLSYHCFRERLDGSFHPRVDTATGEFLLSFRPHEGEPLFELAVPRTQVRRTLTLLHERFPHQDDLSVRPLPLRSIFMVSAKTDLDLEVRPVIEAMQSAGERHYLDREDLEKFRYGDLLFVPELGVLAELEPRGRERKFRAPVAMTLRKSEIGAFLSDHRQEVEEGSVVSGESMRPMTILREPDSISIEPGAIDRSWYYLSVHYGFGSASISLEDVLRAKRDGWSHLETPEGFVDLDAPALRSLASFVDRESEEGLIRLTAAEALRLVLSAGGTARVKGEKGERALLDRLLRVEPSSPSQDPPGLRTPLRPYQRKGLDWLRFLAENGLGGLLCDDMGLGKTHQAMALMLWLRDQRKEGGPARSLVIAPTTVISHWRDKLRAHAPDLAVALHHGAGRSVTEALDAADVVVTSYGVLRNDVDSLGKRDFDVAVFDEIQHLKNPETQAHRAASAIQARVKVGLTGTPIENSVSDLKALFDLVLPGYLGSDAEFEGLYVQRGGAGLRDLKRVTSPFTLRRLKSDVLEELPEKIEDVRICALSEDQVKLYREAIAARAAPLVESLRAPGERPRYVHIFALLTLLKRICDHPALALGRLEEHERYASGKWDLFQELLYESIDAGKKVVVFTQFLGMIDLFERLLSALGIGFVSLTGASRERGEIVRRFNEEEDCRVFLGSLKAGGTGIDLISASVVIHYDRWWNAAREDQATDRVYRLGQNKAVSVLKLTTEGTLEEKISAIIERKRRLMHEVVRVDEPGESKTFTREELVELLEPLEALEAV